MLRAQTLSRLFAYDYTRFHCIRPFIAHYATHRQRPIVATNVPGNSELARPELPSASEKFAANIFYRENHCPINNKT